MATLHDLLFAAPPPAVEDVAGHVLELLARSPSDVNVGNFASAQTNEPSSITPRGAGTRAIYEAFQWLQSRDLIAPANQTGFYFATRKGQDIGTAENLKKYLASQESRSDAAYGSAMNDLTEMKKRAEAQISNAIAEATKEAQSILGLARETAQRVSLEDVQKQFGDAATVSLTGVKLWATLSAGIVVVFIASVIGFFTWWEPAFRPGTEAASQAGTGQGAVITAFAIYHTVLRLTILTAIAAVTTFCLKVFRAQLHLREQNLHRQRVANSMAAFLGAASPEQRDIILGRMVEAITAFGNSGLLVDDDSISPAKVILESMPRALSSKG